jgi:hypothetical protein
MAAKVRIKKPHEQVGVISEFLSRKASIKDVQDEHAFVVSFKHLSKNQGLGIGQWEEEKKLSVAIDVLSNYCQRPLIEQCDGKKFCIYGGFPSKSLFVHPSNIPEDANWARIHIDGTHIIAGHVFQNTFYVVFLDHDHTFFVSEKKYT